MIAERVSSGAARVSCGRSASERLKEEAGGVGHLDPKHEGLHAQPARAADPREWVMKHCLVEACLRPKVSPAAFGAHHVEVSRPAPVMEMLAPEPRERQVVVMVHPHFRRVDHTVAMMQPAVA